MTETLLGPPAHSRLSNGHAHDFPPSNTSTPPLNDFLTNSANLRRFSDRASIILVGIRGAGKRSLGFIAAAHLGRRFITEGHYFQEITGLSKAEYLGRHGKPEYYRCCRDVFRRMLCENEWNCVIECGMASLDKDAQQLLHRFCKTHPVVYIVRAFEQISRILKLSSEDIRRLGQWDASHRHFSNLEFYNLYDSTGIPETDNGDSVFSSLILRDVKLEFCQFVDAILGIRTNKMESQSPFSLDAIPLEQRTFTYAAVVPLSDLQQATVDLERIETGEDAVRLLVDVNNFETISQSIAQIRRKVGVPIIFDVAEDLIGRDIPKLPSYQALLEHGLRLGVEFLLVDIDCLPDTMSRTISSRGNTKIIGRHFCVSTSFDQWLSEDRLHKCRMAMSLGCDLLEFCQIANSRKDNDDIAIFRDRVSRLSDKHIPLTCYNLGALGKSSLVSNPVLTPVKVESQRKMSAELPLVSAAQATSALFASFMLDGLHYAVIGTLGANSLSPAMHNSAHKHLGTSHDYSSQEAPRFEMLQDFLQDPYFGGCSVNTPWKVSVFDQLLHKSPHAEAIGAVNTLLPLRKSPDGSIPTLIEQAAQRNRAGPVAGFYGDNTDWIGFVATFKRRLSPRNTISPHSTGLVLGAGGAARAAIYAMIYLGCQNIFICDRTVDAAYSVARHFNVWARSNKSVAKDYVHVIPNVQSPWPTEYQPPTMIISCIPGQVAGNKTPIGINISPDWLSSPSGGVIADVSYYPVETPLLNQGLQSRVETKRPWILVNGLEMLPEQAVAQYELMTGRRAPRRLMREECVRAYGKT